MNFAPVTNKSEIRRAGIGKNAFLQSFTGQAVDVEWPDGLISPLILIGRMGGKSFLRSVGSFVEAVDDFKRNISAGAPSEIALKNPELTFRPEFEGRRRSYRISSSIESESGHGTVVKHLRNQLEEMGIESFNTSRVDLFIPGGSGVASHVFEVKTDQSSSSLYGAIGQLMFHTALQKKAPRRCK